MEIDKDLLSMVVYAVISFPIWGAMLAAALVVIVSLIGAFSGRSDWITGPKW